MYFFIPPFIYATQNLIGHICAPNRIFIDYSQSSRVSQFPGKHYSVESTLDTMIAVLIAACFCITAMLILLDIFLTYFFSVFATTPVHPITIGTTSVFIIIVSVLQCLSHSNGISLLFLSSGYCSLEVL